MTLPIPKAVLSQHVAILGKTRSGKSSVMRLLVEDLLKREQPVCIVDPKGDWWGIKLAADGKGPGYPVVIFGGEHADIPINEHAGAHVAELFATGNRPCLIDLGGWMVGPRTRFWIEFASTLFKHTRGARWLAVDEVHNFCPKGKVFDADAGKALHWTNRLASEGLGKGVAMLFASQRPQKVHNDTLTSAETLIAMRVIHPSDRGAVSEWIKGCGDSEGSEVLNSLAQMDRGEGWAWSPEIGFGPKRVKFPMFATYDSFRAQTIEDAKRLKGWAEVDLDEVRAKLAAFVEQAKADDPRELRKRIQELERQLRARPTEQVERVVEKIVEVPVLNGDDLARTEKLVQSLSELSDRVTVTVDQLAGEIRKVVQQPRPSPVRAQPHLQPRMQPRVADPRPAPRRETPGSADQSGGDRKILTALAQYQDGRTKVQVAILTGYTHGGGRFNNLLGGLRSRGYIDGSDALRITDAGLDALGSYKPLPVGRELLEYWLAELSPSEGKVLRAIADAGSTTKEQVATATEYEAGGGRFNNILGKLRTLQLITGRGGELCAAEELS